MVLSHAPVKPTANHNTAQNKTGTCPLLQYDYSHKDGRTKDLCFKLVDYPKQQNKPRTFNVETTTILSISQLTSTTAPQFTIDQHRQLLQLLQAGSSSHLANLVGNLYSGATDHIVYSLYFLSSIEPSSPTNPVKLPNDNFVPIFQIGTITLLEQITLHNVLYVPFFCYNFVDRYCHILFFISNLQCSITFFSDHCIFQDRLSRRTIGVGREHNGFYIFHPPKVVFCIISLQFKPHGSQGIGA
ncbi:hypothetical protein AMTRI_Chr07g25760 [Amborella trichopoda]